MQEFYEPPFHKLLYILLAERRDSYFLGNLLPTVYLHSAVQLAVSSSFKDPTTDLPLQP